MKIVKKTIVGVLILLLVNIPLLFADEVLDLHQAISLALQNNKKYNIAKEKVKESQIKIKEAWGSLWPNLDIDFSYNYVNAAKGLYSLSSGEEDFNLIKGSLAVNPGIFYNTLKSAQDSSVIAVNEERSIQSTTITRTIELYYKILLASEIVKLRNDSVQSLKENLRVVTTGFQAGSLTTLDLLRAKVSLANENTRLILAQDDYKNTKADLNIHLGRQMDYLFEAEADELKANAKDIAEFTNISDQDQNKQITKLIMEAIKDRPEIIQVQYKKKVQTDNARAMKSVYLWPTLFVSGSIGKTMAIQKPGESFSTPDPEVNAIFNDLIQTFSPTGWYSQSMITLGASWRFGALAPWDSSHAKENELESEANQTDLEFEDLMNNLGLDIQQNYFKIVTAVHSIQSQKENIKSAEEYFRVATIQFRNGTIDNTKFLEANVELQNAKTFYIQALYDFQTARAELNKAIGYEYFSF